MDQVSLWILLSKIGGNFWVKCSQNGSVFFVNSDHHCVYLKVETNEAFTVFMVSKGIRATILRKEFLWGNQYLITCFFFHSFKWKDSTVPTSGFLTRFGASGFGAWNSVLWLGGTFHLGDFSVWALRNENWRVLKGLLCFSTVLRRVFWQKRTFSKIPCGIDVFLSQRFVF